ncbi:hypothetical protein K474DRAFT_1698965 [Panus rudis PR-1116 ss-1]|nr:hypothetical protein K474DRAFT_1698965 [Panus rudis PR-1116 ss-1]
MSREELLGHWQFPQLFLSGGISEYLGFPTEAGMTLGECITPVGSRPGWPSRSLRKTSSSDGISVHSKARNTLNLDSPSYVIPTCDILQLFHTSVLSAPRRFDFDVDNRKGLRIFCPYLDFEVDSSELASVPLSRMTDIDTYRFRFPELQDPASLSTAHGGCRRIADSEWWKFIIMSKVPKYCRMWYKLAYSRDRAIKRVYRVSGPTSHRDGPSEFSLPEVARPLAGDPSSSKLGNLYSQKKQRPSEAHRLGSSAESASFSATPGCNNFAHFVRERVKRPVGFRVFGFVFSSFEVALEARIRGREQLAAVTVSRVLSLDDLGTVTDDSE